jgi:hypothetical protein
LRRAKVTGKSLQRVTTENSAAKFDEYGRVEGDPVRIRSSDRIYGILQGTDLTANI